MNIFCTKKLHKTVLREYKPINANVSTKSDPQFLD